MRALLYRVGATLFSAAAIVGLMTVIGLPIPMSRQVLIALVSASAVQVYIAYIRRREQKRGE